MKRFSTTTSAVPSGPVGKAFEEVSASFERFCLAAGLETVSAMLEKDAEEVCGPRHARGEGRRGYRGGRTLGKIGFHGGKVELERPRVRDFDGQELPQPSWERVSEEDWLGRWAMNLMLRVEKIAKEKSENSDAMLTLLRPVPRMVERR